MHSPLNASECRVQYLKVEAKRTTGMEIKVKEKKNESPRKQLSTPRRRHSNSHRENTPFWSELVGVLAVGVADLIKVRRLDGAADTEEKLALDAHPLGSPLVPATSPTTDRRRNLKLPVLSSLHLDVFCLCLLFTYNASP
jgi:hypothetical protein